MMQSNIIVIIVDKHFPLPRVVTVIVFELLSSMIYSTTAIISASTITLSNFTEDFSLFLH